MADVLPVVVDMRIARRGAVAEIGYGSQVSLVFEALDTGELAQLVSELLVAVRVAEQEGFRTQSNMKWATSYAEAKKDDLIDLPDDPDSIDPVIDSPISSSPGTVTNINQPDPAEIHGRLEGVKDTWISNQLKAREAEFTETKSMRFICNFIPC